MLPLRVISAGTAFAMAFTVLLSGGRLNAGENRNDEIRQTTGAWLEKSNTGFTENSGQFRDEEGRPVPEVLFKASAKGIDIYITESGISYVFTKSAKDKNADTEERTEWRLVNMKLQGAVVRKENIEKSDVLPGFFNYYLPHCPGGILNVASYRQITVREIYPGIDWIIYAGGKGIKYDFLVHPGASPGTIKLIYEGAGRAELNDSSDRLIIKTTLGELQEGALATYQGSPGNKIMSSYRLQENEVSFLVGEYDRSRTLVIDPPLVWATYYGGTVAEMFQGTATDAAGNVYVAGWSSSPPIPKLNPGGGAYFQGAFMGIYDVFIAKFSNAGVLLWATFYGGSNYDRGYAVTTDAAGNVYVTGNENSADFPVYNPGGGAYFQSTNGVPSVFILKFNSSGVRLWATRYGGNLQSFGTALATDGSGNLYVTGWVNSLGFPTQDPGGGAYFQGTFGGGIYDAFILKFNSSCARVWATYYGGIGADYGYGLATDASGNVFVTGNTASTNFPVLDPGNGAYIQSAPGGGASGDVFISKFDNTGICLWATYYGGSGADGYNGYGYNGSNIVTDASGNIFLTGMTGSVNFPVADPGGGAYFQGTQGGYDNAYILKFDNAGIRSWATYYGGSSWDWGLAIARDDCNNIYITGRALSTDFPVADPGGGAYFLGTGGGFTGSFISRFSGSGAQLWSTYFAACEGFGIATDGLNVFVTGGFASYVGFLTLDPGGGAYFDGIGGGNSNGDAYILKFAPAPFSPSVTGDTTVCKGDSTVLNASGGISYLWNTGDTSGTVSVFPAADSVCYVIVSDGCNSDTVYVTVDVMSADAITGLDTICAGDTVTLYAGGGDSFLWNNGQTDSSIVVNPSSESAYFVLVFMGGCSDTAFFTVHVVPPPYVNAGPDTVITQGSSVILSAGGGNVYYWSPSTGLSDPAASSPVASPDVTTTYTVTATDANGCTGADSVTVYVEPVKCGEIYVPTAFSPNGDGQNDILYVMGNGGQIDIFRIFNRWGEMVHEATGFTPDDSSRGWDGNHGGKPQEMDVYVFYLQADCSGGETVRKRGDITLVR